MTTEIEKQFETFVRMYQALASIVANMPIAVRYKDYISMNMDQGFMWAKEAFQLMMNQQDAPKPAEAVAPSNSEQMAGCNVPDAANDH